MACNVRSWVASIQRLLNIWYTALNVSNEEKVKLDLRWKISCFRNSPFEFSISRENQLWCSRKLGPGHLSLPKLHNLHGKSHAYHADSSCANFDHIWKLRLLWCKHGVYITWKSRLWPKPLWNWLSQFIRSNIYAVSIWINCWTRRLWNHHSIWRSAGLLQKRGYPILRPISKRSRFPGIL